MREDFHESRIEEFASSIQSQTDLCKLLEMLVKDLEANTDEWENSTLPAFLEAMVYCLDSAEYYYRNKGVNYKELKPWQIIADALLCARVYE